MEWLINDDHDIDQFRELESNCGTYASYRPGRSDFNKRPNRMPFDINPVSGSRYCVWLSPVDGRVHQITADQYFEQYG